MGKLIKKVVSGRAGVANARRMSMLALGVLVVLLFGLSGRLYDLQVVQNEKYSGLRDRNSTRNETVRGQRGTIRSSDGIALALTTFSGASLVANPRAIPAAERGAISARLALLLGGDAAYAAQLEQQLFSRRDKYYYCIRRELTAAQATEVRKLAQAGELPGVEIRAIESREYPLGDFGAHIIGFVDMEMTGQEGVERAFEQYLAAVAGTRMVTVDALGRPMEGAAERIQPARDGADVILTINAAIQAIVEDELRACVEKWDPVTVSIIVMDTNSGAIRALANYPSYDPNKPGTDAGPRRNIAITDPFEPGSMFKPLIVCGTYSEGLLHPDSLVEYTPELKVPGRRKLITDHGHEISADNLIYKDGRYWVPVSTALVHSSNTVMARIGLMLGCEGLFKNISNMGFGRRTGFDLGGSAFGESAGRVRPLNQWSVPYSIPSASIGYEVQVTPMQMVNCFNAIANGGKVFKPYVVDRVVARDGKVLMQTVPTELLPTGLTREVTREMMNETLKRVVSAEGTAGAGALKEYRIAGKTGTAMKVKEGQYSRDKVCSFVGYAPADNPKLTVIVVVNEACATVRNKWGNKVLHYGGTVAAPVVSQIVLRSLKHLGVPEDAPPATTNE